MQCNAMQAVACELKAGSFTKAAQTLHMGNSTVAPLVQHMEAPLSLKLPYATSSTMRSRPLNRTVSPARAPSIAWKIGAFVEIPMSSCP